ncbi:MAG: response regulator [Cyclobacteriaceae bacterium]|nr:response regulator [Cyclobacteriaceae bacterium]
MLSLIAEVAGQAPQYRFTRLDINRGLSHNQVNAFLKDSRGFIWIGTSFGLNRYDGNTYRVFLNDSRDATSLSNNHVGTLFEDPDGRIWVSTTTGATTINIYHPETESFTHSTDSLLAQYGMPAGVVKNITKDNDGKFWFTTEVNGVFVYDPAHKKSQAVHFTSQDSTANNAFRVSSFSFDKESILWVVLKNGTLLQYDRDQKKVLRRFHDIRNQNRNAVLDYRVMVDEDGDPWVFCINDNQGLYYLDVNTQHIRHIHEKSSGLRINNNIVRGITQDNNGNIWVGTDHGGVNVIDKRKLAVTFINNSPDDNTSLSQNSIAVLYKDYEGIIWIGTFKHGACYYHENIFRFQLYRHEASRPDGLSFDDINRFVEDRKGNLWLGTNGGGLIYFDRKNNTFKTYRHNPDDPHSLSNDVIVSLCLDKSDILWVGTYYGGLNSFDGRKFTHYRHDPNDPTSISDNNIWEILEDTQGNLWIGTLYQGIDLFDRRTKTFHHYRSGDINSVHSNYISEIKEDKQGNLWIGTGFGFDVYDRQSGRFVHFVNLNNEPNNLSNNNIFCILEDSRGLIWIGTQNGLNLFDYPSKTFQAYTEADGLPHNTITTLLEDNSGRLWMSTPNGLSCLTLHQRTDGKFDMRFENYNESDGLQNKLFNENAAYKTRSGELIFGGGLGFNIIKPETLERNHVIPTVVLTDFQIFNKQIAIGEKINGYVILQQSISETEQITLKHSENVFSVEFAALNFFNGGKSTYRYRLEGFNKDWVLTGSNARLVTYTNLDPGEYTFRVSASNSDGLWSDQTANLKIVILPPFWKTRTAFVLYILAIFGALLGSRKLLVERERMKFRIAHERHEAQRMHELDLMKLKFFTNVSHEFRTPLTLILTPLEKLLKETKDPDQAQQFQLIHRNARRLLNLVNQLLDFRKLEVQEIKFVPSEGDIINFIREVVFSFSDLSEKKDIKLEFHSTVTSFETIFDQDKLEKILLNLLSNAFKFTPEHGRVLTEVSIAGNDPDRHIVISVTDTGIGIATDRLDKIFERFFQNDLPRSVINQGTGIGLSITAEFVKIHGGAISVKSEVGKGSCFTVSLPAREVVHENYLSAATAAHEHGEPETSVSYGEGGVAKLPTLLLVEDNEDFLFYLKDNLKHQYKVLEAKNGKEAWHTVLAELPDLIVSDVMMPEMNGIELCRKIKNDIRVSHCPVILLTARSAEEQKLEGFESGADDYITKPFNFEILQSRIRNLIHQRALFHSDFRKIEVKASHVTVTSLDEKLIQNAIKCVEDNISEPEFSVEELSHQLGMSRVHLYKKLTALTGKSPIEFIRTIRLQQAAQLLEKSQLTVAEVAYKVGFNNPKYFSKYFKEAFHVLPSAYAAEKRK